MCVLFVFENVSRFSVLVHDIYIHTHAFQIEIFIKKLNLEICIDVYIYILPHLDRSSIAHKEAVLLHPVRGEAFLSVIKIFINIPVVIIEGPRLRSSL